jgi:hypothetical protein
MPPTVDEYESLARVWAQYARRFRLSRAATQALLTAIRNGGDPDWFESDGAIHVFVHLPDDFRGAVTGEGLVRAGFVRDIETGSYGFVAE